MAADRCIDFKDEGRKEDVHSHSIKFKKAAAFLMLLVGPETIKRIPQCRNMETVTDEDLLSVERDDGRACSQDWRE